MNNMFGREMTDAPFINELKDIASNMYRMGWNERNGGNISLRIDESQAAKYIDINHVDRLIPLDFDAAKASGQYYLVTGTGKYFKNIASDPLNNLGLARVTEDGQNLELLWGFADGSLPTSEFSTHLLGHITRQEISPDNRVIMHCHPVNTIAMTFVADISDEAFTRALWGTCTECIVIFPDGVSVVPWMVSGTNSIAEATAEKLKLGRSVIWAQHGIFCSGKDMDEAFGLIETIEKAAEIYMKTAGLEIRQGITDEMLKSLAACWNVTPRANILK